MDPLHEAPPKPPPKVPVERAAAAQELPGPFLREYRPSWPYRHRSAQVTVVLYYRNRPPRAVGPEGEEGRMQRWFARPYTAFELQLGWHTASFKVELPAKERGRSFPAEVRVRWKVEDPCLVARSQVTDVAALLVPELEQRLRDVSRAHSINDAEDVHDAVQKELRGEGLGGQFGLELDVFVAISWDKLIQDHGANRGQVLHQTDLEELNQKLRQLRDGNQRELISAWAEDFQEAMKRGDHAVMAQMMARNPQDLGEIRQMFRKEQRESRQDVMELMSRLIDGGLLERWELGEQAMVVVEFLRSSARHVTSDPLPQVTVDGESRRKVFWERADGREDTETSEKRGEGDRPRAAAS
ncbi:hypothetical protein CP970_00990 [Streptomyces kanamyceticus]|uniref:PE-PGRS family protein n=1 Tax=Streptomyces kanamyceticus TaxID=1967 RepID=A0A5J6G900_STRKN|nr:hypothetical protein [Streptomyces kanamyceticus]QEU89716.1 hypothetical protein CP970_00990 [Streptomyces kanamyceticus]